MSRRASVRWAGGALLGLASLAACTSPGAQRIVGPDGTPMAHVHCGADQGACFRIAGELCPSGYDIKPVLRGSDGNFLVRCHVAPVAAVAAVAPPPQAPPQPVSSASRGSDRWPPASEPWPSAYPWPPPETSAAAQPVQPNATSPSPTSASGEVNLGF